MARFAGSVHDQGVSGDLPRRWADHVVRPRVVVVTVFVVCLGATALVPSALPPGAAVRPEVILAVDVFSAFSAFLVALLAVGRFVQSRLCSHVLLAAAMTMLGVGSVVLALDAGGAVSAFGPRLVTGLLAPLLFAVATWVPASPLPSRQAALAVPLTALLAVLVIVLARDLPDLGWSNGSAEMFGASGSPVPALVQAAAALLFAVAAVGAVRRGDRGGDVLMSWLSIGAVLASFSRLDFVLARSESSTWVLTGLSFRLGFYVLLLGGAVQEIRWYWARATEAAVLEERRRIARELHDGLAQELAFVAAQSRIVAARPPSAGRAALVAEAAQRALDESRRAIAALTRPLDEPLDVALTQEVEELGRRFDVPLQLDVEPVVVAPDRREALLRIAREAVTNAARHAQARLLTVQLANHDGVTLRVCDDGTGFDVAAVRATAGTRLGLASMRERAEALGGRCTVTSTVGSGTTVEVWLP